MSNKKGTTVDVLGETHLPADLVKPTEGSNYGLDGYPQLEYNSGLMDQFFDESMLSDVPTGSARDPGKMSDDDFFTEDPALNFGGDPELDLISDPNGDPDAAWFAEEDGVDPGMYIDEFVKSGGVQDLDWLDLNEQDPERLPKNPVNLAIPELEEAWGTERRTNGISLSANNQDLDELKFWESTQEDHYEVPAFRFAAKDLARIVRKAMRRSAVGHPLAEILKEAAGTLEDEAYRVKDAMISVKNDHGLAGNVFIYASAYPGMYRGKDWSALIRKAKAARYILVDEKTLNGSNRIQNGYCTVSKKKAVLEVPWDEAYKTYRPFLEGAGRKVSSGDPRSSLRAAFLSSPESLARPSSHLPKHTTPSERVSSEEAKRQLAAQQTERQVITYTSRQAASERQAAWRKVHAWIEAGLVPREQAMAVVSDDVTGNMLLHRVAAIIVKTKGAAVFSGLANDVRPPRASREEVHTALANWTPPAPIDVSHRAKEAATRQVIATLTRWVKAGFLTRDQASKIAKSGASPETKLKVASKIITTARAATDYSGVVNDRRVTPENDPRVLQAALKKAEADKVALQARIDDMARGKRAQTTRAARRISAAQEFVAVIEDAINRGVRGGTLRDLIRRTIPASHQKLAGRFLVPLLQRTGAHKDAPKQGREYTGASFRPHQTRIAVAPTPRAKEAADAVRFCRLSMNEGYAGTRLTGRLEEKFSKAVLKQAATRLKAVRAAHEGGAGFIYVDAQTYATKTGAKGCERGARQHRADRLHFVMAMDRCGDCALASAKADGANFCRAYNKEIVAADEMPEEVAHLKQANIEESSTMQRTASYFAPGYDPDEYDLSNSPLNDISFHREADDDEIEFTFGGIEF